MKLGPLVSTDWLGEQLLDENVRLIDCRFYLPEPDRGYIEYGEGHIPGARYLSLDDHLTAPEGPGRHPLPEPAVFVSHLQTAGIGNEHTVVIYDQSDAGTAARLWWMLRSLGHNKAVVLDGGWAAWSSEPRSTTTEVPVWDVSDLALATQWSGTIDRTGVETHGDQVLLIDSRAAERHRGEVEPIDPVAGHIPGSINIPYQGNTDPTGRFLHSENLRERFAGVDTTKQVVVYCGSGVTACNNILAMEAAGLGDVLLYAGSWSDWISAKQK